MKDKIINILYLYKSKLKSGLKRVKGYLYLFNQKVLKEPNNRRKFAIGSLTIIVFSLIVHLGLSYGYYYNTTSLSLIRTIVGDPLKHNADYALLIYIENTDVKNKKEYKLTNRIPIIGYEYSHYTCKNNTVLNYDDINKITNIVLDKKEECKIYFDSVIEADIIVSIMREEIYNSNNYQEVSEIPAYGYTYDRFECDNNSVIHYDSELHKYTISTNKKDKCKLYFKKNEADIIVNLFISDDKVNYNKMNTIPSGNKYNLNLDKSECFNKLDESINSLIDYNDGYITIDNANIGYCNVYLVKE